MQYKKNIFYPHGIRIQNDSAQADTASPTFKVKTILLGGVKVEIFYIGKVKVDTDHPMILSYESESRNFLPQNRKVKVCHWGKVKVKCCYMRKLKVTKVPFSSLSLNDNKCYHFHHLALKETHHLTSALF